MKVVHTSLLLLLMITVGEIHSVILKERQMQDLTAKAQLSLSSLPNGRSLMLDAKMGTQLARSPMTHLMPQERRMQLELIFLPFQIMFWILWWGNGKFLLFLFVVIVLILIISAIASGGKNKKDGKRGRARSLGARLETNNEIRTAKKLSRTLKRQIDRLKIKKLDLLKHGANESHIGRKLQKINEQLQQKVEAQDELKAELDLAASGSSSKKRESLRTYRNKLAKSNDILGVFQNEIGRLRGFIAQDKYKDLNFFNVRQNLGVVRDYVTTYFDVSKKKVRSITKGLYSKMMMASKSGQFGKHAKKLIFDD